MVNKTQVLYLILLLITITLKGWAKVPASDTTTASYNEVELLRAEYKKQDCLKKQTDSLKTFIKKAKIQLSSTSKKIKDIEAEIKNYNNILNEKTQNSQSPNLEQMRSKLDKLTESINSLCQDSIQLFEMNSSLQAELKELGAKKAQLESTKTEMSLHVIEQNRPYLELLFGKMSSTELLTIETACERFQPEESIDDFVIDVKKYIKFKKYFDDAQNAIHNKYNETAIQKAINELGSISGINDLQKQEVNSLRNQLNKFKDGVALFKEIISELNNKRSKYGNSGFLGEQEFKEDLNILMKEKDRRNRLKECIEPIPYLKEKYNEYQAAMRRNPNEHPAVELEILSL